MGETLRLSVRALVEFTLHPADITPMAPDAMEKGRVGHEARQEKAAARREVSLKWEGERLGMPVLVSGRADLIDESAVPPAVEEIKLVAFGSPPSEAYPAHRAQAACYAFMLAEKVGYERVAYAVAYVNEQGEVLSRYPYSETRGELSARFERLLAPVCEFESGERAFREARNQSLLHLPFPYDSYRPGQREMAVQVYTAITQRKRLLCQLPTGTGKSAAALFPAFKALGKGATDRIFYLTARTTARSAACGAIERMRAKGLRARALVITAKEKCCPLDSPRCHPDVCPRARGHYIRQDEALREILKTEDWSPDYIASISDQYQLCPFELSLRLCQCADVVICDYNYAFDPLVILHFAFEGVKYTFLADEAHNLPDRARDMLSGALSGRELAEFRRERAKISGRKTELYKCLTALMRALRECGEDEPQALLSPAQRVLSALSEAGAYGLTRTLLSFLSALERRKDAPADYAALWQKEGKERGIKLLALNITDHMREATARARGCVYFSATLSPMEQMLRLLGGGEGDACFSLPSPFPHENLLTLRLRIDTRYDARRKTARDMAEAILRLISTRPGNYIAYFPSYAYLDMIREKLLESAPDTPLIVQERRMDDAAREDFLNRFTESDKPLLGLCVLGGVFSEGVDLPGKRLIGAIIAGVGLPMVCEERERIRARAEETLGDGFGFAYRFPGMHKVSQAAGRVIRSETDRGVVLLMDARYFSSLYSSLLPAHLHPLSVSKIDEIEACAQEFWLAH